MSNTIKTLGRVSSALLLSMLLLAPSPALAHDTLIDTTPADGATVTSDENFVSFRFSSNILGTAAFIAVLDPSGTEVSLADPVVAGDSVSRSYIPTITGTYSASYRVTSSDGHPIEGTITFVYDGPVDETSTAAPEQRAEAPVNDETTTGSNSNMIVILIAVGALLATLAVGVFRWTRSRR